jgi:hypothetical protein
VDTEVQIFLSVSKSCHNVALFLYFLLSPFLLSKKKFMDHYDVIYNYNGIKYGTYEIFDNF